MIFAAPALAADPIPVRTCAQRADSTDANPVYAPGPGDLFLAHRLLLIGARDGPAQEVHLDRRTLWFKVLAIVRRGRSVTITIPRAERSLVRLRYAIISNGQSATTFAQADPAVRIEPCADRRWTYFPGGFVYTRPGCYAVDFRFGGGQTVRRHIPLGKPCSSP